MRVIVRNAEGKSGVLVGRAVVRAADEGEGMAIGSVACRAFLTVNDRIDLSYSLLRNKNSVTLWFNNDEGQSY